jgi:hypothetical protein
MWRSGLTSSYSREKPDSPAALRWRSQFAPGGLSPGIAIELLDKVDISDGFLGPGLRSRASRTQFSWGFRFSFSVHCA